MPSGQSTLRYDITIRERRAWYTCRCPREREIPCASYFRGRSSWTVSHLFMRLQDHGTHMAHARHSFVRLLLAMCMTSIQTTYSFTRHKHHVHHPSLVGCRHFLTSHKIRSFFSRRAETRSSFGWHLLSSQGPFHGYQQDYPYSTRHPGANAYRLLAIDFRADEK